MSKQCSASTNLKALSLQMSRAFARDALTSAAAANNQFSRQLAATGSGSSDSAGAVSSLLHTFPPVSPGKPAVGAAGGVAKQRREAGDRSEAARLGLVNALSFYQEGSMGMGTAAGTLGGALEGHVREGEPTFAHESSSEACHSLTPSPGDVLKSQVDWVLAGGSCTAKPSLQFLEKFGCRTILTYLMRVWPYTYV